jgi:hypothetical protein
MRHRFQRQVSLSLAIATAAGCAANPARDVASNQMPLRLVMESGTGTRQVEQAAGNTYDADGNLKEQHTKLVNERFEWSDFHYYQGPDPLDEQDYFRLSLDQKAYEQVKAARAWAAREQAIGLPLAALGLVGTGGVTLVLEPGTSTWRNTLFVSGIVGTVGIALFTHGVLKMKKRHQLPLERAQGVAEVVESCRGGRCVRLKNPSRASAIRQPERSPEPPAPAGPPPPAEPPVPPASPGSPGSPGAPGSPGGAATVYVGQSEMTATARGQKRTTRGRGQVAVHSDGPDRYRLVFDKDVGPECEVAIERARGNLLVRAGAPCTTTRDGLTTRITIQSGTVEMTSTLLEVTLAGRAEVRGTGKRRAVNERMTIEYRLQARRP